MASQFDVHICTIPVVLTAGTEVPILHFPEGGGGITILDAKMVNAGTSVGPLLVTMTNVGTPALSGTIGYFAAAAAGTITNSATIPASLTLVDAYVSAGEWIGFDQASGTVPAGSFVSLSYIMGK
jgi:hypothetical protein